MKNAFFLACMLLIQVAVKAQMKIGNNSTTINNASLLELETTNKGFVFPRVSLTSVSSAAPLPTGLLTGTVVYNTNGSVTGGNGIGLYVWGGAAWTPVTSSGGSGSNSWLITGNNNVNSSNFLGTTDPNVPLIFKVGGTQAGYLGVSSSGVTTFGVGATAGSQQSTALGTNAKANDQGSLAVGYNALASSQNAISIGSNAKTSITGGIAMGFGANANSQNGVAIGSNAEATTNPNTLALGTGTKATGQNSIAVGNLASAPNIGSEAFGNSAAATGANSMVVGNNSTASGNGAISIGDASTAAGTNSIVLGNNSSVAAVNNSIVLGTNSSVLSNANNTILIGDNLSTSQSNVLILGNTSKTVGISTTTPNAAAKLDVNGPFKLGVNGSVIDNIIKTTVITGSGLTISKFGNTSLTIPGAIVTAGATVIVNPHPTIRHPRALPDNVAIAYAYVSAENIVTINFVTNDNGSATIPTGTRFDITIIQ